MPTPAELIFALISGEPMTREDRRAVALLVLKLTRRAREAEHAAAALQGPRHT